MFRTLAALLSTCLLAAEVNAQSTLQGETATVASTSSAPVSRGRPQTLTFKIGRLVISRNLDKKAISTPTPEYPSQAKAAGVSGAVSIEVIVDESGSVLSARAVDGPLLLRDAAIAAARKARFSPTKLSGQPVKVTGVIQYNFVSQ